jgi:hypothetical protein
MNIPHVNIGIDTKGIIFVTVEDTEVFDYVDDYLTEECDIEYEHVVTSENNDIPVYTMYFPKETNIHVITTVLMTLSVKNIEKIYNINNPK